MNELHYEQVIPDQSSSFRCFHQICDDLKQDHNWHFHPEYELSWVMRSHGLRYVGNAIRPYQPGEIVLYGPNLPHCSRNDPDGGAVEYITVQFDLACLGAGFFDIPEAAAIRALLDQSEKALKFQVEAASVAGPLLKRLVHMSGIRRIIGLVEILDLLSTLGRERLTSDSYVASPEAGGLLVEQLNKVQRYIDQHFRGILSQAEIAGQLGMSPSGFSKFIRASTGRTFMNMVRLARINEACRLLAHSNARITDIALECGYQHTSHFDRHFIDEKGLSPTIYRRMARGLAVA